MTRTPPILATETPGQFITSALFNAQVGGIGSFALTPPLFRGVSTVAQSIPSGSSPTSVVLTSALSDTEGGWSAGTNPSRYTVKTAGKLLVIANLCFSAAGDSNGRAVAIMQNGTQKRITSGPAIASTMAWEAQCTSVLSCAVGDYIEIGAFHLASGALNTISSGTGAQYEPALDIYWFSE